MEAGADAVKVGIGPGFVCTTRLIAGTGVPEFTCVVNCSGMARDLDVPIVADGGIRRPADLVKAIAAGADSVMVGSLFAGTRETPGDVVERNGRRYKVYRGMASRAAAAERPGGKLRRSTSTCPRASRWSCRSRSRCVRSSPSSSAVSAAQ